MCIDMILKAKLLAQACCVISVPLQTSYTPTKDTSTPPNISDNRLKSHCNTLVPALEMADRLYLVPMKHSLFAHRLLEVVLLQTVQLNVK